MITRNYKYFPFLLIVGLLFGCAAAPHTAELSSDGKLPPDIQEHPATIEEIAALRDDLVALNGRTNPEEARQVAETAVYYSSLLAGEYDLVRPAVFHNVLVRIGLKDRGLCHHWTTDLMKQLEALKLKTYQLYWGVAYRGSELREHNSVVVAAKGQNFADGLVLDPWRHSGELYWIPVQNDRYPWKERPRNEW